MRQLTDELLAAVIAGVRPSRPNGKGAVWETTDAYLVPSGRDVPRDQDIL